ncbi:mechanosensitive ion channel domain-containing protein [Porphyrobacter sp. YT40]|uniref:mechanosensitive ion channel family protein n=1 Tax=Porphyrobacter sp. YT40 TaxID=2547601 RepID=UPI0011413881|nr:mechanosensitive ion channel domain-containing protein [Porphyrobacter sp. YT40]QDH33527.1 mechanosensitive ion channel [Porphyrobacter sp. YT40]
MIDVLNRALPDVRIDWQEAGSVALIAAAAVVAALLIHRVLFGILGRLSRQSESEADDLVLQSLGRPVKWAMVAAALALAAQASPLLAALWEGLAGFVVPVLVGWIALAIVRAWVRAVEVRLDLAAEDNLRARRRQTRLRILGRIATFVIIFVTLSLVLLSIPGVREVGVTLMASAGLAALAVGAAAQPALKSLIAGIQMALTEPIRIGDVVVIGGEWGLIEDIRTTYVVVKVWDERRLVVPTTKFLDEIFQNWTKTTARLMGTVFLYVDPAARLDPIREKALEVIAANPRWDGRVKHMQVTDLSRDAVEIRLLMTAKDSPTLFDLRCDVREAMIVWLAETMPEAIVRGRVLSGPLAPGGSTGDPSAAALEQLGDEGG